MNILECTINMKQEARIHYEKLAEIATDDNLKRLFSLMASAEGEHIGKLVEMQESMSMHKDPGLDTLDIRKCAYSTHIDLGHLAEALRNDPDAYRHVEQAEAETIEFFDELGNHAGSEELKKICRLQADKEREHLAMLENIYLFVEEPRTFLEWGEFSNLKTL